jgi:hypothetical protein
MIEEPKAQATLAPFVWQHMGSYALCEWNALVLWAKAGGDWRVDQYRQDGRLLTNTSNADQTRGKNIQDAKRRAQAAAMVLHQLSKNR